MQVCPVRSDLSRHAVVVRCVWQQKLIKVMRVKSVRRTAMRDEVECCWFVWLADKDDDAVAV